MNFSKFNTKNLVCRLMSGAAVFLMSALVFLTSSASALASEGNEGEAALYPLAWKTDLAIWTAVVFVLLLIILWIFAFGPIVKALDLRERNELDRLAAIEKNNADAKDLLEQYRQKLADSAEEVRKILSDAKVDAQKQAAAVVSEAKESAAEERKRALRDIQSASDVALQEIAAKSADLATTLAGKIINEEIDPEKHSRLIESALADVTRR
ncbi:MAG: hypothetical protein ACOX0A_02505 [Thermoguttaceae bacterium]|jgi:F-type H+-transporting ATPase subunit b